MGDSSISGASTSTSKSNKKRNRIKLANESKLNTTTTTTPKETSLPPVDQIKTAALKLINECPPYVHLSAKDSAPPPQLKIEMPERLTIRGGYRGYRMSRASHGVSTGNYFYEVVILPPPSAREIVESFSLNNVRLGASIQKQLEEQLLYEDSMNEVESQQPKKKKRSNYTEHLTGHLRLGWSMRTGELQAPVGYDRWSYGIRSIQGSRIHNSRREDKWGGLPFYPGDVVGIAISLTDDKKDVKKTKTNTASTVVPQTNHIRFFKNGEAMGQFILSKNIRSGGAAFDNIQPGTYYPAISTYMGGTAKVNFGPHFIYPINASQLPTGMKLKPISELATPPLPPKDAVQAAMKDKKNLYTKMKASDLESFKEALFVESELRYTSFQNFLRKNVEDVRIGREERGLSINDLPKKEEVEEAMDNNDVVMKEDVKDEGDEVVKEESNDTAKDEVKVEMDESKEESNDKQNVSLKEDEIKEADVASDTETKA